jgi:hypothetical protein
MIKKTKVTEDHELKEKFVVDVNTPGHDARGSATPLFHRTRMDLIGREKGRCWISGLTAKELGAPLEAHHHPIERSFAERIDWSAFAKDCQAGMWGPYAKGFDWTGFFAGAVTIIAEDTGLPYLKIADPYLFVDNMLVNGMLLGKQFHTGPNEGTHYLPWPLMLAQKYLAEGFRFSSKEVIHHALPVDESGATSNKNEPETMPTGPSPE